ncbi:thermonuclease family protein [soil metagenome]|jgi:micrococcal nuclease
MTLRALLLALVFLLPGCGADVVSDSSRESGTEVTVSRVIDGDTVEVRPAIEGEEDVRLIGVDTPETAGSPDGAQPYGEEASRFTRRVLEGERVTLRFDEEKKDDYGRVLAYLHLPDGIMFNETLLEKGYAQVATFPPNTRHVERFEEAQREARNADRRIWSLSRARLCRLTDQGNDIGGGCGG